MGRQERVEREGPGERPVDRRRLVLTGFLFLVFEGVLIAVFGDYFYTGVSSELGVMLMLALASIGYLLLGFFSRSWLSLLVAALPVLFALALDPPVPEEAWGSERPSLHLAWIWYSIVFLPAWGLGLAASFAIRHRTG